MKIYCVTFTSMYGRGEFEMHYPAKNKDDARKMCEDDFGWGVVVKVEEVMY